MTAAFLEHVNFTVADPVKTAANLCNWFGWHIRWQGPAIHDGLTYHVGNDESYVAIYALGTPKHGQENSYATIGGLNHLGIVVDDLDGTEAKIKADGIETFNHADYEPGRRFYFRDENDIEFEVVSYA
ncbi:MULTISPECIES: VOC family protein [unclassified Thalassospira]|uniref:VOC family protein n=1 Tax=unclassified Thalassospira TaxID=2648997 RepID=UPI000C4EBAF4|nr:MULTISPECIES: VOC family protein [unclassified Thalassospira]MBC45433.1 glyoxalase [Thalassospira sp.]|tara:strand:+ start:5165 stop:5548 length:384 start_codon:yes stop_codon:yes gene_type:complete